MLGKASALASGQSVALPSFPSGPTLAVLHDATLPSAANPTMRVFA
jgi:hypothetical protein